MVPCSRLLCNRATRTWSQLILDVGSVLDILGHQIPHAAGMEVASVLVPHGCHCLAALADPLHLLLQRVGGGLLLAAVSHAEVLRDSLSQQILASVCCLGFLFLKLPLDLQGCLLCDLPELFPPCRCTSAGCAGNGCAATCLWPCLALPFCPLLRAL